MQTAAPIARIHAARGRGDELAAPSVIHIDNDRDRRRTLIVDPACAAGRPVIATADHRPATFGKSCAIKPGPDANLAPSPANGDWPW